jgi:hypothetical protein
MRTLHEQRRDHVCALCTIRSETTRARSAMLRSGKRAI